MVKAYILVKFVAGAEAQEPEPTLLRLPGVKGVDFVMGPYDAVVMVEAADFAALGQVAHTIRMAPGVQDSMTCPVI